MTCATMIVGSPRGTRSVTKNASSDDASTMSGAEIAANCTRFAVPRPRNRYLPSARPTSVPSTTEPTVAANATISEFSIAVVSDG